MRKQIEKNASPYSEDAMAGAVCLVCGELLGKYGYIYMGKTMCRGCMDYIRSIA